MEEGKMRSKTAWMAIAALFLTLLVYSNASAATATLEWTPPTTNANGTPLNDLAGYKVYYGTSSRAYTQVVDAGLTATPSAPVYTVLNLANGNDYYFAVTAYDTAGNESIFSNEAIKSFGGTTTTTTRSTTTTTVAGPDTTPPGDVQNFMADPGDQEIMLSWDNPSDPDLAGVRILYRTDRYPAHINDGILLDDFAGLPNDNMSINHSGLQNGVTYYYSASTFDIHGNYQSTAHASATPSSTSSNFSSQSIGGGCGMVFPTDGKPPGPEKAADLLILIAVMTMLLIKRKIQCPKFHVFPLSVSALTPGLIPANLVGPKAYRLCAEMGSLKDGFAKNFSCFRLDLSSAWMWWRGWRREQLFYWHRSWHRRPELGCTDN
jgi:hypothetical protein